MPENETVTDETVTDETVSEETVPADDENPDGSEALGDAGKKALDSMKGRWKDERDRRRALEQRIAELENPAPKGDDETPDVDAIRTQAAREAIEKANARILRSEVKALAAGKFHDVSDALLNLDLSTFEVDENGDVDPEEISEAIEDLLSRKPHLAATARQRFQGTGDGGAARKASGPSQLTRADLAKLSPAEIVKAKAEGRLANLTGGN